MDLLADDVQVDLREAAGRFFRANPAADADGDLWAAVAELGWTGTLLPEAAGGSAGRFVDLAVLVEENGAHLQSVPFTAIFALSAILELAGRASDPIAAELAAGTLRPAWCGDALPGASGGQPLRTRQTGAGLELEGVAEAVEAAAGCTHLVVRSPAAVAPGFLLVPRDADGVTIEDSEVNALDLTRSFSRVVFSATLVGEERLLRIPTEQVGDLDRTLAAGAATLACADSLGSASAVLKMTVEHLAGRRQFGQPLAAFQAVKHTCADMKIGLEGATALLAAAALAVDEAIAARRFTARGAEDVAAAKVFAGEQLPRLISQALQLHGGIGFTWEYPLHRHLRRAKLNQSLFGSPSRHAAELAEMIARASG